MTDKEVIYEDMPSGRIFTNIMPVCFICGKETHLAVESRVKEDITKACMQFSNNGSCAMKNMERLFDSYPEEEFILSRNIEYKNT